MRVNHDWELQDEPAYTVNWSTGEKIITGKSSKYKVWVCKNCGERVLPTEKQYKMGVFRKPNKKRKFSIVGEPAGYQFGCRDIIIRKIHDS